MLKAIRVSIALTSSLFGFTQSPLAPNAPADKPVETIGDAQHQKLIKAIAPFVEQAKKSWPTAKEKFLKGLPQKHVFFVTVELLDMRGKREIVFVEVQTIEKGIITGLISNEITTVLGFHLGQNFSTAENNIIDWTISKPDGSEEGNLVGKFLETYKP